MIALCASAWAEGSSQQILGLSLGQSAADPSDPDSLRSAMDPAATKDVKSIAYEGEPYPHFDLELTGDRTLRVWFDEAEKDRPIFWVDLGQSYDPTPGPEYAEIVQSLGRPLDYEIAGPMGAPLDVLLIKIDPSIPTERKAAIKQHIDEIVANRPTKPGSQEDPFVEMPYSGDIERYLEIFGDAFRGKFVTIYTFSLRIDGTGTYLFDAAVARKVLTQSVQ
jgi:hypothetical protein